MFNFAFKTWEEKSEGFCVCVIETYGPTLNFILLLFWEVELGHEKTWANWISWKALFGRTQSCADSQGTGIKAAETAVGQR